MLFKSIDW